MTLTYASPPDPSADDIWCVLLRSGSPGDTFRFLHGLETLLQRSKKAKAAWVICRHGRGNAAELLDDPKSIPRWDGLRFQIIVREKPIVWIPVQWPKASRGPEDRIVDIAAGWQRGIVRFRHRKALAKKLHNRVRSARGLYSSYSDGRSFQRTSNLGHQDSGKITLQHTLLSAVTTKNLKRRFRRIDCKGTAGDAFAEYIPSFCRNYEPPGPGTFRVAVVLRGNRKSWRDSPDYHFDHAAIRQTVATAINQSSTLSNQFPNGAAITYFGYESPQPSNESPWPAGAAISSYGDCLGDWTEQLMRAGKFHLATGINSSQLDIFCVAGVPVLRECEFQSRSTASAWPFGKNYNRFLASGINISLGIGEEEYSERKRLKTEAWASSDRFHAALSAIVKTQPWTWHRAEHDRTPAFLHIERGRSNSELSQLISDFVGTIRAR